MTGLNCLSVFALFASTGAIDWPARLAALLIAVFLFLVIAKGGR